MNFDRALAVSAHGDDAEFGCAGLLQRVAQRRIVVATCGERGGDADKRRHETRMAATMLAAELDQLHHQDTRVDAVSLTVDLERIITAYRPELVLVPSAHDTHQDHVAVYQAGLRAVRDYPCVVLAYMTPSAAVGFRPNWFASISHAQLQSKLRAIACHTSQRAAHQYLADDYVLGEARRWAMVTRSRGQYVEPYELVRLTEAV